MPLAGGRDTPRAAEQCGLNLWELVRRDHGLRVLPAYAA